MHTVLLIDDNKMWRLLLKNYLEKHNYLVLEAAYLCRATEILEKYAVDLILLDLSLPDGNGLPFIKEVKGYTDAPVIIVSSDSYKETILEGYRQGADDYVRKDCDMDVLMLKISNFIKRYGDLTANENDENMIQKSYVFDDWSFDVSEYHIEDNTGEVIPLTKGEHQLLKVFIEYPDHTLSKEKLCESLMHENYQPSSRALDLKVSRLRKKINQDKERDYIQTVHGVGYMFQPNKVEE